MLKIDFDRSGTNNLIFWPIPTEDHSNQYQCVQGACFLKAIEVTFWIIIKKNDFHADFLWLSAWEMSLELFLDR